MVKLNRIYTRTGDDGTTGLVDGSRVAKSAALMAAIGDVDEANSAIGVAIAALSAPFAPSEVEGHSLGEASSPSTSLGTNGSREWNASLRRIQNDLFDLGADLATPAGIEGALRVTPSQVVWLEHQIDALNADLAPLTSFILPGGTAAAPALHVARATVRRAERSVVAAGATGGSVGPYLNRLSDYLFVLARAVNRGGGGDVLWQPGGNR